MAIDIIQDVPFEVGLSANALTVKSSTDGGVLTDGTFLTADQIQVETAAFSSTSLKTSPGAPASADTGSFSEKVTARSIGDVTTGGFTDIVTIFNGIDLTAPNLLGALIPFWLPQNFSSIPISTLVPVDPGTFPHTAPQIPFWLPQDFSGFVPPTPPKFDMVGTLPRNLGFDFCVLGDPPIESKAGEGWDLVVRAREDFQPLAVVTDYLSLAFVKELSSKGSGSVELDLDDPFWQRVLSTGISPGVLLDEDNIWEIYHKGVLKFQFLGTIIEEKLLDSSETRSVKISGSGAAEVMSWAKVLPSGFPQGNPKMSTIADQFSTVDSLDRPLWNYATIEATTNPLATGRVIPSLPDTKTTYSALAASPYDMKDSYFQCKVAPGFSPTQDPFKGKVAVPGPGTMIAFMHIGSKGGVDPKTGIFVSDFFAQIRLDATNGTTIFTASVFDGQVANYQTLAKDRWMYLPDYDPVKHLYWRIRHSSKNKDPMHPHAKGTFYFGFSPDKKTWTEYSIGVDSAPVDSQGNPISEGPLGPLGSKFFPWGEGVSKDGATSDWDLNHCFVTLGGQKIGDPGLVSPTPGYFPAIWFSDVNNSFTPGPLMGEYDRLFNEAQGRGALSAVTRAFTAYQDGSGAAWKDAGDTASQFAPEIGKDYLSMLDDIMALIQADWVFQPGFVLDVRLRDNMGRRLEDQVIFHEGGDTSLGQTRTRTRSDVANYVVSKDNANTYQLQQDAMSEVKFGHRESFITTNAALDPATLAQVAAASLSITKDEAVTTTLAIGSDFDWDKPAPEFDKGNRIMLDKDFAEIAELVDLTKAPQQFLLDSCDNLLTANQESLETNANEWQSNVNCAVTRSNTQALSGLWSLRMTSVGSGSMSALDKPSYRVTVAPGQSLLLTAWFRASTVGRSCRLTLLYHNGAGNSLGSAVGNVITDSNAGWLQASVSSVVPTDAAKVSVLLEVLGTGAGEAHYIDRIMLLRPNDGIAPTQEIDSFELVRVDNFDRLNITNSDPDAWDLIIGSAQAGWGNGTYNSSAVSTLDGRLIVNGTIDGRTGGLKWKGSRRFGAWEARVRVPAGCSCYHPVFRLRANGPHGETDVAVPSPYGNIDFIEVFQDAARLNNRMSAYQPANSATFRLTAAVDMTGWHIYRVEWTPKFIACFIDGARVFYTEDPTFMPVGEVQPEIRLDWWSAEGATSGASLEVDYIAEYKLSRDFVTTVSLPTQGQHVPFVDYDVGDWIGVEKHELENIALGIEEFSIVPMRIMAISVGVDSSGVPSVELTLQSILQLYQQRVQAQIDKLGAGLVSNSPVASPIPIARVKYDTTVGDAVNFTYVVRHGMNTQSVIVQVFMAQSPFTLLDPQPTIKVSDKNTVSLTFIGTPPDNPDPSKPIPPNTPPAENAYMVVVRA